MSSAAEVLTKIRAGKLAPVYLLSGEIHPQLQVLEALRQAVLGGEENDFNFDRLEAAKDGVDGILAAARTLPMLGDKRLVLVRDLHQLKADELKKLVPYVEDPSPRTCLVLLAAKIDARLKICVRLKKAGGYFAFEPLKERKVPAWLQAEAKLRKITLKPGAAQRVAESVGTDMGQLAMALEQLQLYVGPGNPISPDDVEDLLAETRERSVFELTNAVGRGQRREALLVLRRMLDAQASEVLIVTMLTRHVRQLWTVLDLGAQHLAQDELARRAGVHRFFVRDMAKQARRIGAPTLRRMHRALFEADRAVKSSPLSGAMILERLVYTLCP